MENGSDSPTPDAATCDPASDLHFPSEEARLFYLQGARDALSDARARPVAAHPHLPPGHVLNLTRDAEAPPLVSSKLFAAWDTVPPAPDAPAQRHDGWTPTRERIFLTNLAETGVVADACRAAGLTRESAYARRNSAAGHAFALGWDAANLLARHAVADDVASRSRQGVIDRLYRNGELVAERHRYDNRLTMAHLTRLDRLAAESTQRPEVHAVAAEFDRYLDLLPQGNAGADRFLAIRFPLNRQQQPREMDEAFCHRDRVPLPTGSERALLARHTAYAEAGGGLSGEIPIDDLDPADMLNWTEAQLARARHGGLLDMLGEEGWPAEISAPPPDREELEGADAGVSGDPLSPPSANADGSCQVRELRRLFRLCFPAVEDP